MEKLRKFLKTEFSRVALILVLLSYLAVFQTYKKWRTSENIFAWDVSQYYIYLPAIFIYKDLGYDFIYELENKKITEQTQFYSSPIHKRAVKMNIGVSIMYTPFFCVAHLAAKFTKYPADGYSKIYAYLIAISGLLYGFLGLLVLRKYLLNYFNDWIVGITILAIGIGTNLLTYAAVDGAMSHASSFFLFSLLLYYSHKLKDKSNRKYFVFIGIILGIIFLIRPTNLIIGLIPLYYFFVEKDLKRIQIDIWKIVISLFAFVLVSSLQFGLWKYQAGSFFHFSYNNESFFFNDPKVYKFLFSFRKGWLLYTPLMVFALVGFYPLIKKNRVYGITLISLLFLCVFILASWWCWWFGGSFGQRSMIEFYTVLSIAFCSFFEWVERKKIILYLSLAGVFVLIGLNLKFNHLYQYGILHDSGMTKKAFYKMLEPGTSRDEIMPFIEVINNDKALQGER